MNLSIEEIIKATNAIVIKNAAAKDAEFSFSTDTRTIKKGEMYLPLKGENFDGEKFINKALEVGAAGFFCTRKTSPSTISPQAEMEAHNSSPLEGESKSIHFGGGTPCLLILQVENTLTAYLQLASFYRKKINPKVVAITGSSGKTTTKEMAYCVASEKFKTHKSELNFNNEIGLCKTILSMPEDTEVLILEMGMRGLGEIELLSKYSEPDITIIANVGTAHIGRLGSCENIAKAKCEIIKHQKKEGILIAHNDELIKKEIKKLSSYLSQIPSQIHYFSNNEVKIIKREIGYSKFIYKENEYELNIEGNYNIQNSLAAIEMGLSLKMKPEEIRKGLLKYAPIEKRWEIQEIKGFKIINDSYNANPESVKASLQTFLELYSPPLLIVLGDMAELGEHEIKYHQEIGDFLCESLKNVKNVKIITVGTLAKLIASKLIENNIPAVSFINNTDAALYIVDNIEFGTTIILKASRSMKFEEIIDEINKDSKK